MVPLELLETFQNMLVSRATGGLVADREYREVREAILQNAELAGRVPRFVRTCRDCGQFWGYIKKFPGYQRRREHIWEEFRPAFEFLEGRAQSPADRAVAESLQRLDEDHVREMWTKALERRLDDPEGAITISRTLLESVCKLILDGLGVAYEDSFDLPKLYKLAARSLNLAPDQHSEQIFKQILGGCQSVVEGLGALRNKLSDSHGKGKAAVKPQARHAELAVNLAGATATFVVATWEARKAGTA